MTKANWLKDIRSVLLNRRIVGVRYMTQKEQKEIGWYSQAIVLKLEDGTQIFPMCDDEGNDAGALATTSEKVPTIPVFR